MDEAGPDRSDEALLAAFAGGERDALGELAARHERALLGLAMGLLGSRALAEEAVQEAWVGVIRGAGRFAGRCAARTWMYRIVINRCRDVSARERARRSRDRAASAPERTEPGTGASLREEVRRAVERLSAPEREALLLCHHADLTHAQAAEVLGLPLGTLKGRVRSALRGLDEALRVEVAR